MSNLTDFARGQTCTLRLPGCRHNPETVVGAHIRRGAGIGRKPSDLCLVHACVACHDRIDGRAPNKDGIDYAPEILRALCETLERVGSEFTVRRA